MKIALLTLGTRGDVQPYIALGKALRARGHEVVLAGPDNFAEWVAGHGLRFHPLGIDMHALMQHPLIKRFMSGNWLVIVKLLREVAGPMFRRALDAVWEAARDAEVVVYHPKMAVAADVCEATGATPICTSPIPLFKTGDFPVAVTGRNFGRWLNRLTYVMFNLSRLPYFKMINRWRRETLGLGNGPMFVPFGAYRRGMATRLCCVSPAVVPRPSDWDAGVHMTGYWFLDEASDWRPDDALAAFLGAGEPPVYIGFGSMTDRRPDRIARVVVEAVRRAGVRAVLATGWGGIEKIDVPGGMHIIDKAPHDALFERMSAVVHHGGAGTTAAGLRAGRPTLVCPQAVDQPFWGRRVWTLGCGPKPQPLRRLNAERLAEGLKDLVGNTAYRERADEVSRQIQQEDGIGNAIAVIEQARAHDVAKKNRSA